MTLSRREFIQAGMAAGASVALCSAAPAKPVLGLIAPPENYPVPPEGLALYDSVVDFKVFGLGVKDMTPAGFDPFIDKIAPAGQKLAKEGAQAIVIFGTSLTFYNGAKFNEMLMDGVRKATGLKTTSMSTAVVAGLKEMNAKRIAVATAYADEVNGRLKTFLREHGFEVLVLRGLGLDKIGAAGKVSQDELQKFGEGVFREAPKADAMLVSCGGLRTLELVPIWEKYCNVPIVSSTPHALWAGARLVGANARVQGYGRLIAKG
jgi:arylmalonate decarboxylase